MSKARYELHGVERTTSTGRGFGEREIRNFETEDTQNSDSEAEFVTLKKRKVLEKKRIGKVGHRRRNCSKEKLGAQERNE